MRLWWGVAACVAMVGAGCGEPAAPSLLRSQPLTYLLSVDQLVSPDFTADVAPHRLGGGGYVAGAGVEYLRAGATLADANGPIQVRDTVEEFASAAAAATVFGADVARLDAIAQATSISTGTLGDEAHAIVVTAVTPAGVRAVEFTVEWRVTNVLDILVVRGRDGGTRLDDALVLAHRQTVIELGLATPAGAVQAPASPSPR